MTLLEYLESPEGRAQSYTRRLRRRLILSLLDVEPLSKKAMPGQTKLQLQRSVARQMRALRRRAFRGPLVAAVRLATTAQTPPSLYSSIKNLLDLFGRPLPRGPRRSALVYKDDSQIRTLSVSYTLGVEKPEISATFARLGDFIDDVSLAYLIESGYLPALDPLDDYDAHPELESALTARQEAEELRGFLGDDLVDSLVKHWQQAVQQSLLSASRLSFGHLYYLYLASGVASSDLRLSPYDRKMAEDLSQWPFQTPVRLNLPKPPEREGESKIFRDLVAEAISAYLARWRQLRPLYTPVALEVVFKPAPGCTQINRDLDNLIDAVLSQVGRIMRPPSNFGLAMADRGSTVGSDRLPPASLRYGVCRVDIFHIPRRLGDDSPGFLNAGFSPELIGTENVWSRADQIIRAWQDAYEWHLW